MEPSCNSRQQKKLPHVPEFSGVENGLSGRRSMSMARYCLSTGSRLHDCLVAVNRQGLDFFQWL